MQLYEYDYKSAAGRSFSLSGAVAQEYDPQVLKEWLKTANSSWNEITVKRAIEKARQDIEESAAIVKNALDTIKVRES